VDCRGQTWSDNIFCKHICSTLVGMDRLKLCSRH
jgi:hypothetical protein